MAMQKAENNTSWTYGADEVVGAMLAPRTIAAWQCRRQTIIAAGFLVCVRWWKQCGSTRK